MSRAKPIVEDAANLHAPTGPINIASVIEELWYRAYTTMGAEELKWFAGAKIEASAMTESLIGVVDGIAGLVAADRQAGDFQHKDDVAQLLWVIGASMRDINSMNEIARMADYRLKSKTIGGAE